ncbi:MAG: hypothetical protein J5494_05910, partial [Candidatus Methanomethylophilaceae archaeon]|nr:hypothetical protein [Candidatus Methanomethylophilaceae archaeon]
IVFPFAGFALYLVYGCNLYSANIFGKKIGRDRKFGLMDDPRIKGADSPTDGNDVRFFSGFRESLPQIISDLDSARASIHLELYRISGEKQMQDVVDALCRKAAEGLDVRLLTGRGIIRSLSYMRKMNSSGVKITSFHRRFFSLVSTSFRLRNRRMMMIADGSAAYAGEQTFVRIAGPAASRLEARFLADWSFAKGIPAEKTETAGNRGSTRVQIVSSGPDVSGSADPAVLEYVAMIKSAVSSVILSVPYLVPDENIYNFLKLAALSGKNVSVIVPEKEKYWYQRWNTVSAAGSLLESGIRVFFSGMKIEESIMCVDESLFGTGLPSFNSREMLQDFNTSVLVRSEPVSGEVRDYLNGLISESSEFTEKDYAGRGISARVKIAFSRLMMYFNRGGLWDWPKTSWR